MQDEKSLVALIVKRRQQLPVEPSTLQPLSREQFIEDYGVDEAAEKQVIAWAKKLQLAYRVDSERRAIFVVASETLLTSNFGVVEHAIQGKAARLGVARLPPELTGPSWRCSAGMPSSSRTLSIPRMITLTATGRRARLKPSKPPQRCASGMPFRTGRARGSVSG